MKVKPRRAFIGRSIIRVAAGLVMLSPVRWAAAEPSYQTSWNAGVTDAAGSAIAPLTMSPLAPNPSGTGKVQAFSLIDTTGSLTAMLLGTRSHATHPQPGPLR